MRKTHIALLVAVFSAPVAMAADYQYYTPGDTGSSGYDSGYGYDDGKDIAVTDSFNKDIDKTLTVNYDKDVQVKDSYNYDDDYLSLYNVNNTKKFEYTDNSVHDYSQDWDIDIELNKYIASSYLDGSVTYNKVDYNAGGCCAYDYGYGYPSEASNFTVKHENMMDGAFVGASGINVAAQNAGNNSLIQQSASTNAQVLSN